MIPNDDEESVVIPLNNGEREERVGAGILSELGIRNYSQPLDFRWCVGCDARLVLRLLFVFCITILTFVSFDLAHTVHAGLHSRFSTVITRHLITCTIGMIEAFVQEFFSCREAFCTRALCIYRSAKKQEREQREHRFEFHVRSQMINAAEEGTNDEGHGGLAKRPILGGVRRRAQDAEWANGGILSEVTRGIRLQGLLHASMCL
jgi:hypothetical protein